MAELQRGAIFAGHRIEGVAGRGGFGVVYRATHLVLDHVVALKLISSARAGDETFRERFKSESRIAVSIRHPNVVAVHNAGEEDGLLYVTMDFVEGTDLRGLLNRKGRLSAGEVVPILAQVASALDAAHAKGLVHRDIKPANVLIDESAGARHVFLTDFGLSKRMEASTGVTATGAFVGTLDYVAPEQIKGERVDARTDVYALGCVAYELLVGSVPFSAQEEKVAKIYAHLQEPPPELEGSPPDVPPALKEVIRRAMAKDPDARQPSAGDFARAAEAAVRGERPTAPERSVGTGAAAPTQAFDVLAEPATEAPALPSSERPAVAPTEPAVEAAPAQPATTRRGAHRGRWLAAAIVAAVLAAGGYALLVAGGEDGGTVDGDAPGPVGAGPVAEVRPEPVGVAVGDGTVWVSSRAGQSLERLDEETGEPIGGALDLSGDGEQVAIGMGGDAWVAVGAGDGATGHVLHYAPNGRELGRVQVGDEPRGVAVGESFAWAANINSDTVTKIDNQANTVAQTVAVGAGPSRAVAGGARAGGAAAQGGAPTVGIWVANSGDGTVSRITQQGAVVTPVQVGGEPRGITVGAGDVWVADRDAGELVQIEPGGGAGQESIVRRIDVGEGPRSAAFGFGSVWVTNGGDRTVSRVDPATGRVETIDDPELVGSDPEGIAAGEGGIWVTSAAGSGQPGTVHFIEP